MMNLNQKIGKVPERN